MRESRTFWGVNVKSQVEQVDGEFCDIWNGGERWYVRRWDSYLVYFLDEHLFETEDEALAVAFERLTKEIETLKARRHLILQRIEELNRE